MTSLKIPELNLFNSRRQKHHSTYNSIGHVSEALVNSYKADRQFTYKNNKERQILKQKNLYNKHEQYQRLYQLPAYQPVYQPIYQPMLPTRYKQIAENYLHKLPVMYDHYYHNNGAYEMGSRSPSPSRRLLNTNISSNRKSNVCQCQNQHRNINNNTINMNKNSYLSNNLSNFNNTTYNKQIRIQKQPYLVPTFRQNLNNKQINFIQPQKQQKQQNPQSSMNSSFIDTLKQVTGSKMKITQIQNKYNSNSNNNQNYINNNYNSSKKININNVNNNNIQRLRTNQSGQQQSVHNNNNISDNNNKKLINKKSTNQVQIQTEVNQSILSVREKKIRRRDPSYIEQILREQQYALQQLCLQFQDEENHQISLNNLQMTKDEIMQKSKQILLKLNQCSDDKRDFSLIAKVFNSNSKKMHNPFGILSLE